MADYSEQYIDSIFYCWYDGGRKINNELVNIIPKESGKSPNKMSIQTWKETRGWIERADALDAEVSRALDEKVVNKRKEMYEKQVEVANELIEKGRKFLDERGLQTSADALRAVDLGLATQRISTGMAEAYIKISKMSDDQLSSTLQKLLGQKKEEEVIEADVTEED